MFSFSGYVLRSLCLLSLFVNCFSHFVFATGEIEFSAIVQEKCSIKDEAFLSSINDIYASYFKRGYYDRSVYYFETDINPLDASDQEMLSCSFDSLNILEKYGATNCVGMALQLQKEMKNRLSLNSQLVTSTIPPFIHQANLPEYSHSAVLTWCTDGYILLDPSMNLPSPIVLTEGSPSFVDLWSRGRWKFEIDLNSNKINVTADSMDPLNNSWTAERKESYQFYYPLAEVKNPDDAITAPFFLNDRKLPIFRLTPPDQVFFFMTLNLTSNQVEYSRVETSGELERILTLDFEVYYDEPDKFKANIQEKVLNDELTIDKKDLLNRIEKVLNRIKKNR